MRMLVLNDIRSVALDRIYGHRPRKAGSLREGARSGILRERQGFKGDHDELIDLDHSN